MRGELARLEHEGVAGGQAGRDLPGHLEQRVVPRRDQRAHADRLVHDPADHVGVAGVDHPAGVLGGDPAVVAEDRDHVVHVVVALDQPLAGVEGLGGRARRRRARAGRRRPASRSPRSRAARAARGRRGRRGAPRRWRGRCPRPRLVDLGDQRAVGRAADLAARATPARSSTRRRGRAQPPADPLPAQAHCCVSRNAVLSAQPVRCPENAVRPPGRQAPIGTVVTQR